MPKGYSKLTGKPHQPPSSLGRKLSKETKNKISLALSGRVYSENTLQKMRNAQKMEKHYNWKGGISFRKRILLAPTPKPEQCEVCGAFGGDSKKGICYDHDHLTGKFRGWLCIRCNLALGMVKDNTETLLALIDYIRKSRI